jgi:hypothetical protein
MMMLSDKLSQEAYLNARKALNNVARSIRATKAQREEARKARTRLTLDFIGGNIQEVEARTRQFREFINEMENAIERIGKYSPIHALETLKNVVEGAHRLIGDAPRQ